MNLVYATRAAIPYPSAASWNTVQMCQSLAELGHDVTLAVGRKFWRRPQRWSRWTELYGLKPQFRFARFWEWPKTGGSFDRRVTQEAQARNAVIYTRYTRILHETVRQQVPSLLELHAAIQRDDAELICRALRDGSLRGVVVITMALRNHLLSWPGLNAFTQQIVVAPDAVDVRRFDRWQDTSAASDVGYVGSLFPGKGMEIIASLAPRMGGTQFHVYGGRPEDVQHWRRAVAHCANLSLHGYLAPALVPERMLTFSIAVLPNQPAVRLPNGDDIGQFTSPMKLFEYMAAGRAVVASDLPGLREVLRHEANCLLVPHDDTAAWQQAIDRLQRDTDLRTALVRQAREDVVSRFTYAHRFQQIFAHFASGEAKSRRENEAHPSSARSTSAAEVATLW